DVPDKNPPAGPPKTAVGKRGTVSPKPAPTQCSRYRQHLPHARSAARPFVANDQDIARLDLPLVDGSKSSFLAVKDPGNAAERLVVVACNFNDTAFRGQIALENHQPTRRL